MHSLGTKDRIMTGKEDGERERERAKSIASHTHEKERDRGKRLGMGMRERRTKRETQHEEETGETTVNNTYRMGIFFLTRYGFSLITGMIL